VPKLRASLALGQFRMELQEGPQGHLISSDGHRVGRPDHVGSGRNVLLGDEFGVLPKRRAAAGYDSIGRAAGFLLPGFDDGHGHGESVGGLAIG
jgi:hypothetical protein